MNTPAEISPFNESENAPESDKLERIERVFTSWKMEPRSRIPIELPERKDITQWSGTGSASIRQAQHIFWIADRVHYALLRLSDSVEVDHDIRSGVPVLRGTRVPLSHIIAEIAEGDSIMEIADDLELDVDLIRGFFEGFSVFMDRPFK